MAAPTDRARRRAPAPAPRRSARRGPTLVLLVRHGRTATTGTVLPGRAPGLHLSEEGRADAERAAARIAALPRVDAVYASPLERTRQTAAPIARATGTRVRVAKGLLECDFGDWTGRRLATLRTSRAWQQVQTSPSRFRFPGGESFAEMQGRIWGELERLVAAHPGGTVVAVSHADPIKAAVAMACGIHLDLFQRIVISPCSVTPLLVGAGAPVVLAVNSTGDDLASLAPS
jgi:probable phosphoglycerate mutase